jgi:hypothetical protein
LTKAITALLVLLSSASTLQAQTYEFKTAVARYLIESNGSSRIDATEGSRHLQSAAAPFVVLKVGTASIPASKIVRSRSTLTATFGASGVEADLTVTTRPQYFVVELTGVRGGPVDQLCFAQLRPEGLTTAGDRLAVRWNDDWAVSLTSLRDTVESKLESPHSIEACAVPALGLVGQRVAAIVSPTAAFLDTVRQVERDWDLPSPSIAGRWAKQSEDVRTSYLFVDLDEANVDDVIRYAQLGHFRYVLVYSWTWSASLGSYPINPQHFPNGEEGLRKVIERCHAAGIKVGMHMLTSLVDKRDPLVHPKPHPGLLKDADAVLAASLDEHSTAVDASTALDAFPSKTGYYGAAFDVQIDDEIIHYQGIRGNSFVGCTRGYAGTTRARHQPGARIHHLAERLSAYLADLRGPLKDTITSRIADVINRCGFDMIYFDGAELNAANGPAWYWVGVQQAAIWPRVRRDLLVQGSAWTHWTWHMSTRGTCDDAAAIGLRSYMDVHKIADVAQFYRRNFMPVDLGWIGFMNSGSGHPATLPKDLEHDGVRMLALDAAAGIETTVAALKGNGRAEEALRLFGQYEQLRLAGSVPDGVRHRLLHDEWHLVTDRAGTGLHRVNRESVAASVPADIGVSNPFAQQSLKFRVEVRPTLAAPGDPANVMLLGRTLLLKVPTPATTPGALASRLEFTQAGSELVEPPSPDPVGISPRRTLDLLDHKPLAVTVRVDQANPGVLTATINVQLQSGSSFRDHYVDLNFTGERTIILAEPDDERIVSALRPDGRNYPFLAALRDFNYAAVSAINIRWMRVPSGGDIKCSLVRIEALGEKDALLKDLEISTASGTVIIPGTLQTGSYAESWGDGVVRAFDKNGAALGRFDLTSTIPSLSPGKNTLTLHATGKGDVKLTILTFGERVEVKPAGS